ncbi:hypothetical protein VTJ83DRAFT_6695 [Remersonia thermophila]|uniref:Uncharacterized protein n=1 Tax=Remersonia thermophila TaxID=72144 RepID=A0ABR4D5J4_9PEZI
MSGGGGFYKYRCKNFYTHNCPNWVYCNGHACSMCLAEGRDAAEPEAPAHAPPRHPRGGGASASAYAEICVPQAVHGTLRYTVMEIVPADEPGPSAYWILRQKALEPRPLPYSTVTTSATPRPVMTALGAPGQLAY